MSHVLLCILICIFPIFLWTCAEDIPIPAPTEFKVERIGKGEITLSWYPVIVAEAYWVHYDTKSGPPYAGTGAEVDGVDSDSPVEVSQIISEDDKRLEWPKVTLTNLTSGMTYYFSVSAWNDSEQGEFSEEITTNIK